MTRTGRRKSTLTGLCVGCGIRYKLSPTGGIINYHPGCNGIRKPPVEGSIRTVQSAVTVPVDPDHCFGRGRS